MKEVKKRIGSRRARQFKMGELRRHKGERERTMRKKEKGQRTEGEKSTEYPFQGTREKHTSLGSAALKFSFKRNIPGPIHVSADCIKRMLPHVFKMV